MQVSSAAEHGAKGNDHNVVQGMPTSVPVPGVLQWFHILNQHPQHNNLHTSHLDPYPNTTIIHYRDKCSAHPPKCDSPGGFPPVLDQAQQEELKEAVQQPPTVSGMEMGNWYWKVVRQYVSEQFGISLSRSSCLNYLHRLGFAFKQPKKRLLKADAARREAFVMEYAALREEAQRTGAKVFFADEAHFRADAELRGKWVLKGEPALVDSTSPRYGDKASYYSPEFGIRDAPLKKERLFFLVDDTDDTKEASP